MIEVLKNEGKTEEEVKSLYNLEEIHFMIEEIPGKLFKGKKVIIKAIKKEEVKNYIKDFINNIAKAINITIKTEIKFKDECYFVMLISEDNSILIGKDGKTINSIQLLLHQSLNASTGFNIRINVDAAGYKANKEKRLEFEIKKIAKDVARTKIEAKLDPMNSYDRRLVHNIVGQFSELKSSSEGEEPLRYVVISYKED